MTAAFPRGISLELTRRLPTPRLVSPTSRAGVGGPAYWASRDQSKRGTTSISWSSTSRRGRDRRKAIAVAAPQHGWPLDKKDPIAVPHCVGKRIVGTILGFYAITRAPAPNDASFEAALAFPVGPKAFTSSGSS